MPELTRLMSIGVFIYVLSLYPLTGIALNSLLYHEYYSNASENAMIVFFNTLRFPLNRIVMNKTILEAFDAVEQFSGNRLRVRLGWSTISVVIILVFARSFIIDSSSTEQMVSGFWILMHCFSLTIAWRFGHKLKDIEASLYKPNTPGNS